MPMQLLPLPKKLGLQLLPKTFNIWMQLGTYQMKRLKAWLVVCRPEILQGVLQIVICQAPFADWTRESYLLNSSAISGDFY